MEWPPEPGAELRPTQSRMFNRPVTVQQRRRVDQRTGHEATLGSRGHAEHTHTLPNFRVAGVGIPRPVPSWPSIGSGPATGLLPTFCFPAKTHKDAIPR